MAELDEVRIRRIIEKMDRDAKNRTEKIARENEGRFGIGS